MDRLTLYFVSCIAAFKGIFYRPLFSEGQPFVLPYLCFRYSNHRPASGRFDYHDSALRGGAIAFSVGGADA